MAFTHCACVYFVFAIETWWTRAALVSVTPSTSYIVDTRCQHDRMAQHSIAQAHGLSQFEGMRKQTAMVPRISRAASMVCSVRAFVAKACNHTAPHRGSWHLANHQLRCAKPAATPCLVVMAHMAAKTSSCSVLQPPPSLRPAHVTLVHAGGTRFIGVYLARQLVEEGHTVTLLTRGKKPITFEIPDDTPDSYARYAASVKHIAADRKDPDAMVRALSGQRFDGALNVGSHTR